MHQIKDVFEIDDLKVFDVLNNPMRLRILRRLAQPASVKELAEWMGVPTTRLYYHVNLMEEVEIIAVVETRKVGAMIEKVYQTTAHGFRPSKQLMAAGHEPEQMARLGSSLILDGARLDAEAALTDHFANQAADFPDEVVPAGAIGRSIAYLDDEGVERFKEKIQELLEFLDEVDVGEGDREFGFSFVFFPVAGSSR